MTQWIKSSFSGAECCIELAELPNGNIAIRDSKHPGQALTGLTKAELAAFIAGARAGEFDELAEP